MGAYSQLDMERQYDGAFQEDDTFFEEDDCVCEAPVEHGDAAPKAEPEPVPAPVPQDAGQAQAETAPANDTKEQTDEDAKRKAHEEAEAKRKAEFDARQAAKKAAEQEQLAKLEAMSEDDLLAASMKRVSADTEKLTRRNRKECVAEYIQTMCIEDSTFARKVMHPRKSMVRCFWYINRKAREFIEQEMKDNDFPKENGVYGSDVPDGLCYQWAVDYFNDPDTEEDHKDEEKFEPKPYYGTSAAAKKPKEKAAKKKAADMKKPTAQGKAKDAPDEQMSLLGVA